MIEGDPGPENDGLDLGIPVGMGILHSGRILQVQVLGRGLSSSSVRSGFRPERKNGKELELKVTSAHCPGPTSWLSLSLPSAG